MGFSLFRNSIRFYYYIKGKQYAYSTKIRASLCGEKRPLNNKLTNIQNQLIKDYEIIKEGPNTDLLSKKSERLKDYCHFSLEGYDKFSDMWVESLTK